jgi:hypothetical protein
VSRYGFAVPDTVAFFPCDISDIYYEVESWNYELRLRIGVTEYQDSNKANQSTDEIKMGRGGRRPGAGAKKGAPRRKPIRALRPLPFCKLQFIQDLYGFRE